MKDKIYSIIWIFFAGFSISNAVDWYNEGVLSERLTEMTSLGNFSLPAKLLNEICFDWIDAMVIYVVIVAMSFHYEHHFNTISGHKKGKKIWCWPGG